MMLQPIDSIHSHSRSVDEAAGSPPAADEGPHADAPAPTDPLWQSVLDRLPTGVAVLDAYGANTLWTNSAMETLLREGTGTTQAVGRAPFEYLPGLEADEWEEILEIALHSNGGGRKAAPHRLQFVHYATRNIAYWEWSVLPA